MQWIPSPIQDTSQGSWFSYYRDGNQYIGVVTKNGEVFIFNTAKNVPVTVKGGFSEPIGFNNIPPDIAPQGGVDLTPTLNLPGTWSGDLQFITIEDYTYVTNRENQGWPVRKYADYGIYDLNNQVKVLAYGRNTVYHYNKDGTPAPINISTQINADPTVQISINDIFDGWNDSGTPVAGWIAQLTTAGATDITRIGNGVYFRWSEEFNVNVLDTQTINGFTNAVNSFDRLPFQCKDGMIVEVTNTDEAEEDGFWVQFQGTDGVDGVGVWEETVEPNQYVEFDADYMYAIVRNGVVHLLYRKLSMKNVVQVIWYQSTT